MQWPHPIPPLCGWKSGTLLLPTIPNRNVYILYYTLGSRLETSLILSQYVWELTFSMHPLSSQLISYNSQINHSCSKSSLQVFQDCILVMVSSDHPLSPLIQHVR